MSSFQDIYRKGWQRYLFTWVPVWLVMAAAMLHWGYDGSFLLVNSWRLDWLDAIMPHFTHVGDGLILFAGVGIWLISQKKTDLWMLLAMVMLSVLLVVFLLKNAVFHGWFRPSFVFEGRGTAFFMISTRSLSSFSFPSGHATAAAAACMVAAMGNERGLWPMGWGVLGILLAYSRVYIGVHFVGDILAGGLLGCGLVLGLYRWVFPGFRSWTQGWGISEQRLRNILWGISLTLLVIGVLSLYSRYYGI